MSFSTNLGQDATCKTLYASSSVQSPSFSQPEQVSGSAASPLSAGGPYTQAYTAGITKYVFYSSLTNNASINYVYTITGLPATFPATTSVRQSVLAVASATFGTRPIISVGHLSFDGTGTTLTINPISSGNPVFASGTAYLKVVVEFTTD